MAKKENKQKKDDEVKGKLLEDESQKEDQEPEKEKSQEEKEKEKRNELLVIIAGIAFLLVIWALSSSLY